MVAETKFGNILDEILAHKLKEVEAAKAAVPLSRLKTVKGPDTGNFAQAIQRARNSQGEKSGPIKLIAELKKASPVKGVLREDFEPVKIAKIYQDSGASALSVLTDVRFFQGSLDYLSLIKKQVSLPLLRKDFIIDPYQIYEARAAGADAVLLIVAALEAAQLREFIKITQGEGLSTLVEVHNQEELAIALKAGASLIGINNRNLKTFTVTLDTTYELIPKIPSNYIIVSESGIHNREQVLALEQAGVDAILVGESLVKSGDIGDKVKELLGA